MRFISSYYWNRGGKDVNEDSLTVQSVTTRKGPLYMACICHGIGGLFCGEAASGFIVEELTRWFYEEVIPLQQKGKLTAAIEKSFYRSCFSIHENLKKYGERTHRRMGSTCTCLILTKKEYHMFHIGDTRVYRIGWRGRRMTEDHMAEAHMLTKCIGTGIWNRPDYRRGYYGKNESFFLCSDGYGNQMSEKAMINAVRDMNQDRRKERDGKKCLEEMGKRNLQKGERDNMSAIYVRQARE